MSSTQQWTEGDLRQALSDKGDRRAALQEETDKVMQELVKVVRAAKDAGLSVTEIGSRTGLSRETIYQWTKGTK